MNWKNVEVNRSNQIKDIILAFVWRDWRKMVKIQTEYISEAIPLEPTYFHS
jgi:hypothetical protein